MIKKRIIAGCEATGHAETPYLTRWSIGLPFGCALYLHRFHRSDANEMHDHPWSFISLILWRGYVEVVPEVPWVRTSPLDAFFGEHQDCEIGIVRDGMWARPRPRRRIWPGSILFRRAEHVHRVELLRDAEGREKEAWTLILRGPRRRDWGFHTNDGWVQFKAFFARHKCKENVRR